MIKHTLSDTTLTQEEISLIRKRYHMLRSNARRMARLSGNPIEFKLTIDEWYTFWKNSGHYEEMGTARGQYVLARKDLSQDYTIDNIEVITINENIQRHHQGVPKNRGRSFNNGIKRSEETKEKQRQAHQGHKPTPSGTPIKTPDGIFASVHAAAEHYGINVTAIHYFKRKYPNEYYYVK